MSKDELDELTTAAQLLGSVGGRNGTGDSKKRSTAHYKRAGRLGGRARAKKLKAETNSASSRY